MGHVVQYDMVLLAAWVMVRQTPAADVLMRNVVERYQKFRSFSAKVIHHADFMADVKDSIDTMAWLAPRRFELVSDKDSVPKLFSDGRRLTTFIPHISPVGEPLDIEPGRSKTWEGRGGLVLSLLMKGPVAEQLFHPPKQFKVTYEHGPTLHWHDLAVSEIIETVSVRGASEKISYYLSGNYQQILGTQVTTGPESSWTQYSDIVENPDLPKTLGSVAKS